MLSVFRTLLLYQKSCHSFLPFLHPIRLPTPNQEIMIWCGIKSVKAPHQIVVFSIWCWIHGGGTVLKAWSCCFSLTLDLSPQSSSLRIKMFLKDFLYAFFPIICSDIFNFFTKFITTKADSFAITKISGKTNKTR